MDDSMVDFDDDGASSDFVPEVAPVRISISINLNNSQIADSPYQLEAKSEETGCRKTKSEEVNTNHSQGETCSQEGSQSRC
jgi:hypothetical protein